MASNVIVLYLVITFLLLHTTLSVKCGPRDLCSCSTMHDQIQVLKIDCRRTRLHIHEVCEYINRANITVAIQLDVSQNNITHLNRSNLIGCKNVSSLAISRNRLCNFTSDVFSDIKLLTELDLSRNKLSSIYVNDSKRILVNLPKLKHLWLNGNFEAVGHQIFSYPDISNLTNLTSLTIDGLQNAAFGFGYSSLKYLIHINLNGLIGVCNIGGIEKATFESVPHVQDLDLSQCNLTNISEDAFIGLSDLRWLDLSLNRKLSFRILRNISFGLQFTKIDFLNFSRTHKTFGLGTKLLKGDVCYLRNTTIREISLAGNRLEMLEDNLALLFPPTLQSVHFDENRFTFGPYLMQLGCYPNLTEVTNNDQNKMHDPRIFLQQTFNVPDVAIPLHDDCPYLNEEYLRNSSAEIPGCTYIDNSPIDLTKAAFPPKLNRVSFAKSNLQYAIGRIPIVPFLNHIEYIDVSGNVLYSWLGPIGPLLSVKFANLSRNYCSYIGPNFFSLMTAIEILDIHNNFVGIPLAEDINGQIFKPLKKLKRLIISANQIKTLPPCIFQHLENLESLDLSHNILDEFTISIEHLRNLTTLDLSNNAIQSLPDSVVDHFQSLSRRPGFNFSINLYKNPIRCSCSTREFLEWMVKNSDHFQQFQYYSFVNENGHPIGISDCLSKVNNFDKSCRSYTIVIIVCTLTISVFLATILVGMIYKNRWKLRYFLYMKRRKFYGYLRLPDEGPIENFKYDAFISYADTNINFIRQEIIPNLEAADLSLCIHQRDFIAGNAVADNIMNAIESSKKTVVLLSKSFLKSNWCLYEFNMARMESIYSRNDGGCLIVVMLEQVPTKDMPLEMLKWIKEESYIEFTTDPEGYQLFWNNLKDAIKTNRV